MRRSGLPSSRLAVVATTMMMLFLSTSSLQLVRGWSTSSSSRAVPYSARQTRLRRLFSTSTPEPPTTITTTTSSRLSRQNLSLDLKTIDSHLDIVLSHLQARNGNVAVEAAKELSQCTAQRVTLIQQRDEYLNQRKQASGTVGEFMKKQGKKDATAAVLLSDADQAALEQAKELSTHAAKQADLAEAELETLQTKMDGLLSGIPNLLDDIVPDGADESDNQEVYTWGNIEDLPEQLKWKDAPANWEPAWHDDVAVKLNGYLAEAAVKISGARFVALSGNVARLERALGMFMLDTHTSKGYTEVTVPYVVSRSALEGTSQLPKFEEDLFAITQASHTCNGEDAFLIPTAEVPVTNLHREEIIEASDLPKKYVCYTPCFRAEAGSYGRDTKGLIRTHQFHKVELVKITSAETSAQEHEDLTKDAEAILQALKLPYRKVRLCSGDIGFAAQHCYDLEVWLPGAKEFREISSCSNCGDFQARRMSLRYRPASEEGADGKKKAKKAKPQLCHTINGSGLAVGRTLVAVLENYQRPDGSVVVPEVLRPYMGGLEVIQASN